MPEPGKRANGLVETVDIYPTLAELCGLHAPDDLAGKSFSQMLFTPEYAGKGFAYSFKWDGAVMGKTLRTDCYRAVQWKDKNGNILQTELYDHRVDPDENENIADKHPDIVKQLVSELEKIKP
jgi:arylsulfatase A-like enzyme